MDTRAFDILRRIRTPQSTWNTEQVVDNVQGEVPPGGQPANAPGIPSQGGPTMGALQDMTAPPPIEMDASQPLDQTLQQLSSAPQVNMDKLSALLKSRASSKQNFLGG